LWKTKLGGGAKFVFKFVKQNFRGESSCLKGWPPLNKLKPFLYPGEINYIFALNFLIMKFKKMLLVFFILVGIGVSNPSSAVSTKIDHCEFFYPSGCFDFRDDCGNDVSACWSCNFDCSAGQVVSAIASFIGGYGCGNYSVQEYPY
jgi:hypothetical protein